MFIAHCSLFTAIILCTVLPSATGAAEDDPQKVQQILTLYQSGQTTQADSLLVDFRGVNPTSPELCKLELAASRVPRPLFEAINRLRKTSGECQDRPEGPLAKADLARLYHLSGQDTSAYDVCRDFLLQYPGHAETPEILLLQGALEMSGKGGSRAGNSYAAFLAKYPGHPKALIALVGVADAKVMHGDWAGAHQAYLRALEANPTPLDLPKIYFHLGLTAEKLGQPNTARHYYQELIERFGDTAFAARAKDRLDSVFALDGPVQVQPQRAPVNKYALSVGSFANLEEAENAGLRFAGAGYKIHFLMRDSVCELLVGEFDSEQAAQALARELYQRYQIQATPRLLP